MSLTDQQRSPRLRRKGNHPGSYCCVLGCSNNKQNDKLAGVKLSYHRFPLSDPKRTKLWIDHIRREAWFPKSTDRICSIHFEGGKKSDDPKKPGYIPSIFPFRQNATKRRNTITSSQALSPPAKRVCRKIFPDSPTSSASVAAPHPPPPNTPSDDELTLQSDAEPNTRPTEDIQVLPSQKDHDYVCSHVEETPCHEELERLKVELYLLKQENEDLKKRTLSLSSFKDNDASFQYMTNLPTFATFEALAKFLHGRCGGRLNYWRHQQSSASTRPSAKKPGRERALSFQEELFLVLVRLKRGLEFRDMHLRTGISIPTLSRIYTTWINFLNNELTLCFEMAPVDPSHVETMTCLDPFPDMRIMLDCTELFSQRSTDLQARKETFSNYKHHDTVKFLVGMGRYQAVNFVSAAWGGRATDKHITLNSEKLLSNLTPGTSVMADRGFLVTEELRSLGVKMIMPHFKGRERPQFSAAEARRSAQISSARIHIERIIQRIKTFQILERSVRMDQKDLIEQTFRVCAYLVNLQRPIIKD